MQENNKLYNINTLRHQNEDINLEIDMSEFFPSEEEIDRRNQAYRDRRGASALSELLAEIKYEEALRKRQVTLKKEAVLGDNRNEESGRSDLNGTGNISGKEI